MVLQTPPRFYPYLGDAVAVRLGSTTLTGYTSKSDDSIVDVSAPLPGLALGVVVDTAWRVGDEVHRCDGVVEELRPDGGFSVRLGQPRGTTSRRLHQRYPLSLRVGVEPVRAVGVAPCRSVDVSQGGMRAAVGDLQLRVGETVALEVALGEDREDVYGRVVWQDWQSFGHVVAGLEFVRRVDLRDWYDRIKQSGLPA